MKTKKHISTAVAMITVISICITLLFAAIPQTASAATADSIAATLTGRGLTATVAGNTVSVTGSADLGTNGITLNIDSGVTVDWDATLNGRATANNYLLTLSGSGTFNVNGGTMSNTTGAGGTLYISSGVTLNINGGTIDSPGSGSAVTISAGTQNAVVNVQGGTIRSTPNGYAINDGAGMVTSSNNTVINIKSGLVEAGAACAIRSTGISSVVNVSGGEVRNAATSNSNPVIIMNYTPPPSPGIFNVNISGGLVRTTGGSNLGYTIQTSQNIRVTGGELRSTAGRTINLAGMNSIAEITGGKVTTQTGTAISTATTILDEIANAKIIISGGIVEATGSGSDYSGTAVRITGANSTVSVSGSALVTAKAGLAIDASGRPSDGSVTVSGGLVFAWGNGTNKVVSPAAKLKTPVGGTVVAWDTADGAGKYPYLQNASNDLFMLPSGSVKWDNDPPSADNGGIRYAGGNFYKLNVTVYQNTFTLTVINGTTSGGQTTAQIEAGTKVNITTKETPISSGFNPNSTPINGNKFDGWRASSGSGVSFESSDSMNTSFTMPSRDVTVTASFLPRYLLHVEGGNIVSEKNFGNSASYGYYYEGEEISIHGNSGYDSLGWQSAVAKGDDDGRFDDPEEPDTFYIMPGNPAVIYWEPAGATNPTFAGPSTTRVVNGKILTTTGGTPPTSSASHTGYAGTGLVVEADDPDEGYEFDKWEITSGSGSFQGSASFERTIYIMPSSDAVITATYKHISYTLTVKGGTPAGSSAHYLGDKISIAADIPDGMVFSGWSIDIGGGYFDNPNTPSTVFHMPDCDAVISAHFEYPPEDPENPGEPGDPGDGGIREYILTIRPGDGPPVYQSHKAGDIVSITASPGQPINPDLDPSYNPANGTKFVKWEIVTGGGLLNNAGSITASYVMPPNDATVSAVFTPLYLLRVIGGTIDPEDRNFGSEDRYGYYAPGTPVHVSAYDNEDHPFAVWEESLYGGASGGTFADANSPKTVFTMPAKGTMIIATENQGKQKPAPVIHHIQTTEGVINGVSGIGSISPVTDYTFDAGVEVNIAAREANDNEHFVYWEIVSGAGHFIDQYSPVTAFSTHDDTVLHAVFAEGQPPSSNYPDDPADPGDPVEPSDPPQEPQPPRRPSSGSSGPGSDVIVPRTGVDTYLMPAIVLASLSLTGAITAVYFLKKRTGKDR